LDRTSSQAPVGPGLAAACRMGTITRGRVATAVLLFVAMATIAGPAGDHLLAGFWTLMAAAIFALDCAARRQTRSPRAAAGAAPFKLLDKTTSTRRPAA